MSGVWPEPELPTAPPPRTLLILIGPNGEPEGTHMAIGSSIPNVLFKGAHTYARGEGRVMVRVAGQGGIIASLVAAPKPAPPTPAEITDSMP